MGGLNGTESIGSKYFGTSSCVLRREAVLILDCPLSEISLYVFFVFFYLPLVSSQISRALVRLSEGVNPLCTPPTPSLLSK